MRPIATVKPVAIVMDVFLFSGFAFLMANPVKGQLATYLSVTPANTVTGTSALTEDGPRSSARLNTTQLGPVTVIDELTLESVPAYQVSVHLMRICMLLPVRSETSLWL